MNRQQLGFFYGVIKPRLVELADSGCLPEDLTNLSHHVFDKQAKNYNAKNRDYEADIKTLEVFTSDGLTSLKALQQADHNANVGEIVELCQAQEDLGFMRVDDFFKTFLLTRKN
jgi:hypothetical protein